MSLFEAAHQDYEAMVCENLASQPFMSYIGAEITDIQPGICEISVANRDDLSHHPGGFHPGVIDTIAMNAAGYAALTISQVPSPYAILTVEHNCNLLSAPGGEMLIAPGFVLKPALFCNSGYDALRQIEPAPGMIWTLGRREWNVHTWPEDCKTWRMRISKRSSS